MSYTVLCYITRQVKKEMKPVDTGTNKCPHRIPDASRFQETMADRATDRPTDRQDISAETVLTEAIMLGINLLSSIFINLTYCLHLNTLQLTSSLSPSSPASFPPYHLPSFVPVVWNDLTFSIIPTSCLSSDVKIRKTKISYTSIAL